ncbi:hypothetical protein ACSW9O_16010 (plasmid) [Clostridium perfringens]
MARRKTHEEFVKEVEEKYHGEYKILSEYINAKTKIKARHNCGYEWEVKPYNLLNNGRGCPICGEIKRRKIRTKTHSEFVEEVRKKLGDEYSILGEYKGVNNKIKVRHNCSKCNNYEWEVIPSNLLKGQGCPSCKIINLSTSNEEFQKLFEEKYGDKFTLLDEYKNSRSKLRIKHNCEYCGNHIRIMRADAILERLYCKVCDGNEENKKTINMKFKKKNIELIEEVKTKKAKHKLKCLVCGEIWESNLQNILRKDARGCPVCANKKVVKGINDIATTHPHLVKYFVNKEDAYKYSYGNGKKRVPIKCLDCGDIKHLSMNDLTGRYLEGFHCSKCSDGTSYPEKLLINVLEQIGVYFKSQYSPKWIKPKKYDFYIKDYSCIIETHGRQHYKENTFKSVGGRTLEEEQQNDKYKKEMALKNRIKHYIILDCRNSNLDWIKKSILNSELSKLFDLTRVNWNKAAEFANSNRVKKVCDYWNNKRNDETTVDVGKIFKLDRTSIGTYLKKGTKLGWCNYNPKEESLKGSSKSGKASGKNVMMLFKNGDIKIFNSCHEIERLSEDMFGFKIYHTYACRVAKGTRKSYKDFTFKYVEDLTPEERIKYNIDEKLKELEKNH